MEKGKIIFLNGVSSSGKTTLAKALQDSLPEPPYYISNDLFAEMIPGKYFSDSYKVDETFSMMYRIIKTFSETGVDVIVDSLFLSTRRMNQCVGALHEYPVLFVHVTCPADELRRREEKRGDREIGQGESQLAELNPQDGTYDVTALLERVISDAVSQGFKAVEGYVNTKYAGKYWDHTGPARLYEKFGFAEAAKQGEKAVMRKNI